MSAGLIATQLTDAKLVRAKCRVVPLYCSHWLERIRLNPTCFTIHCEGAKRHEWPGSDTLRSFSELRSMRISEPADGSLSQSVY